MKRIAAHFVYCNPQRILSNGVVEVNDSGIIVYIFSLNDKPQECNSTIFYNGIIIPFLLEKEISNLYQATIFDTLNQQFIIKGKGLKEGEKPEIYLLENLDLIEKKFLKQTTINKLL